MDWKLMLSRLKLLLWKNMVIRRRNVEKTCLQIFLPPLLTTMTIMFCIYAPNHPSLGNERIQRNETSTKEINSCDWIIPFTEQVGNYSIGFTPNSREARTIVEQMIQAIELGNCRTHGVSGSLKADGFDSVQDMKMAQLQREINVNRNRNGDEGRKLYVGIAFNGICKQSSVISYKIWHRKEKKIHETIEREDLMMAFGAKWKKRIHQDSPFSFSRKAELKRASFQMILDKVLLSFHPQHSLNLNQTFDIPKHEISLEPFPPNSTNGNPGKMPTLVVQRVAQVIGFVLPIYIVILFSIADGVVNEKKSQFKSLLTLMGIPRWMHTLCWFVDGMVIGCSSIALIVASYKFPYGDFGFKDSPAPFSHSDFTPLYFIFVVYTIHGLSLTFLICSFFNTAHVAMISIVVVMSCLSHAVTLNLADFSSFQRSVAVMLLPNSATALLMSLAADFELQGVGLHWSNFCDSIDKVDSMSILDFVSLQGGMSVVNMLLAQYMENILLQDSYGVAKPFYYPFLLSTWFSFAKKNMDQKNITYDKSLGQRARENERRSKCNEFELEPPDIKPGVEILGLTKEFSQGQNGTKKRVVDDFHLNLPQGQITVLLGHNGSGKTTLISMLTGLTKPTTGTAVVNGHNLNLEMEEIHKDLGFCPQKNVLSKDLSVVENLLLFGQLKGLSKHQVDGKIQGLLDALGLQEKKDTPAKFLSGGQKRKLQLTISLMSDSKVVYLDEPTSGMDPGARRLVWDFLLETRRNRTILLTTHFMEEAEVCGDRIAIMEAGKLKYCGTSFFLKRLFETGYTLHLNLNEPQALHREEEREQVLMNEEKILSMVWRYVKGARVKPRFVQNNMELDIILPMVASLHDHNNDNGNGNEKSENKSVSSQIPLLLQELYVSQENFKIRKTSLFITTMDDIFSSAISEDHLFGNGKGRIEHSNGVHLNHHDTLSHTKSENGDVLKSPLKLTLRQMSALVKCRIEYCWNNKILLAGQLSVYWLTTALATTLVQNKTDELWITEKAEEMKWNNTNMEHFTVLDINSSLNSIEDGFKGFYSPFVQGSAQFASNRVANSILKRMTPLSGKILSVRVAPPAVFQSLEDYDMLKRMETTSLDRPAKFLDAPSIIALGQMVFTSNFLILPLQEKYTRVKHLEMMTGLSPLVYWTSLFLWDFFLCTVASSISIVIMILVEGDISVSKHGGLAALALTLSVTNFSMIVFLYFVTTFFPSPASGLFGFAGLFMTSSAIATSTGMLEAIINLTSPLNYIAQYSLKFFPPAGFIACMGSYYPTAIYNSRCNFVPKFIKNMTCDPIYQQQQNQDQVQHEKDFCCDNMRMKKRSFLEWDAKKSSALTNLKSYDAYGGFQGLGQELVIVVTVGVLHLALLFAIEYKIHEKVYNLYLSYTSQENQKQTQENGDASRSCRNLDQDVQKEQDRVKTQTQGKYAQQDAFMCVDLCKKFGNFQAVSNLTFGVHPGECFGLLGVNGAGKSTTFSMLTGALKPSFGNVFINGRRILSLLENPQGYLKNIGYCPQIDALLPMLTGRQHLELFARLRGCSSQETKIQVQRWLHNFGLEECADYQCGNYSGGMQRRLNTAISMIANPSMILLDEPSSGVDPVSRRQFWRVVASLKNSGQSVILTSHCMEECENLCARLAIMVGGQIQCLGSPNSLRNKCPQGYVLKIQLRSQPQSQSQVQNKGSKSDNIHVDQLETLISEIINIFHPCSLQEFHQNRIQFSLANKEMSLAEIFTIMEEISIQHSNQIQEYCLGETTLEQIFLAVATSGGFDTDDTEYRDTTHTLAVSDA